MEQQAQNAGSKTRVVRTEEQLLKLLEEFAGSGCTANGFCVVYDINEATAI